MSRKKQGINLLHIYGQESWHNEAYIVGNKSGLQELKKAIEQALNSGRGETGEHNACIYVNDGEGYKVQIIMNNTNWLEPFWKKLALPYTEVVASDKGEDIIWPWKIKS